MILTPALLQKPALTGAVMPPPRAYMSLAPRASAPLVRPVLHTLRSPQQLCLDLQPRLR